MKTDGGRHCGQHHALRSAVKASKTLKASKTVRAPRRTTIVAALVGSMFVTALAAVPSLGASSASVPPVVQCTWGLPLDAAGAYRASQSAPLDRPCAIGPNQQISQRDDIGGLAQLADADGKRTLELWAAVSHPTTDAFGSGAGSVEWVVRAPSGSTVATIKPDRRSCGGDRTPGAMWTTASTAGGPIDPALIRNANGTGIWQSCRQGRIRIYVGRFSLPASAECGAYSIAAVASVAGSSSTKRFGVDVECPASVAFDASRVQWNVMPGATATVVGDTDPKTTDRPTVTNSGKGPIEIGISFTPLRLSQGSAIISSFGATLIGAVPGEATSTSDIEADTVTWLTGPTAVICPGKSAAINLSVHAPAGTPVGQYQGSVKVVARPGGRCS
jgi:hypothetical protein